MDKSLGTLLSFWGVFQFTQVQPLPSPPKQCWTRVSRVATLYRVGGGRTERKFRKGCPILRGNREITEKYEYCSTVPRTFCPGLWLLRRLMMFSLVFLLAICDPSSYGVWQSSANESTAHSNNLHLFDQSPGKMGRQTRPFTYCKLHEVTHYPTINSVGLLVPRTRSIFPWLFRVVSDRSVRYNGKHP